MVSRVQARIFATGWNIDQGQSCDPCCDKDNFRIDLFGPPTSPWNKSAARVFCQDFTALHGIPESANEDVIKAFETRVKTLKAAYRTFLKNRRDPLLEAQNIREVRRQQRKYKLFVKRLSIAQKKPQLHKHIGMLRQFGPTGMSSDESSGDEIIPGQPSERYHICQPRWRASRVTTWLRTLDVIHLIDRGLGRGRDPRLRITDQENPRFSTSLEFVSRLPRNAYDDTWLGARNDTNFTILPSEESYDFSHDADAIE